MNAFHTKDRIKNCTRADTIRNEAIRTELNTHKLNQRIDQYNQKWKKRGNGMDAVNSPKKIRLYRSKEERDVGRTYTRWEQVRNLLN